MSETRRVLPGNPYPLGATWDGDGVNFALYSENATEVELCLVDDDGRAKSASSCASAPPSSGTPTCAASAPGSSTAIACTARTSRSAGFASTRTSSSSIPTPRRSTAPRAGSAASSPTSSGPPTSDLKRDRAGRPGAPLGVVVDTSFDWGDDAPPNTPFHKSIIYEAARPRRSRCATPTCPSELRGKYVGLASDPMIRHLRELGVTARRAPARARLRRRQVPPRPRAAQLLGLQHHRASSPPRRRYRRRDLPGSGVREFKAMVKALHAAGIEVILDVVYNHTAEGNHLGPDAQLQGHRQPDLLPTDRRRARASTSTTPARATASTCVTRRRCSSSWTRSATGCSRCTSTASASTSRRRSRAASTRSTSSRASSPSSTRTRSSAR